jgi:hypothetical protein
MVSELTDASGRRPDWISTIFDRANEVNHI